MTGIAARELSPLQGCLSFAEVAAVRDTLTPTRDPGPPEPAGRTIMRDYSFMSAALLNE